MSQSVEFKINDITFYAYNALSEDQTKNLIMLKVKKGSSFPTKQEYSQAKQKARELLDGGITC